jgi:hypothetical protein
MYNRHTSSAYHSAEPRHSIAPVPSPRACCACCRILPFAGEPACAVIVAHP